MDHSHTRIPSRIRQFKLKMGIDQHGWADNEDAPTTPHPDLDALQVATLCIESLKNQNPMTSLEVCFNFSSDRCRAAVGGSLEEFVQYASNPIFGQMVNCDGYEIVSVGPVIPGGPHRGAMQTVLMDIKHGLSVQEEIRKVQEAQRRIRRPTAEERAQARREERLGIERGEDKTTQLDQQDISTSNANKFLWTLQKERRPPRQDCWLIHEVLFVENAFKLTE